MNNEDHAILLKIKRDFSHDESVQSLLKIMKSLEYEVGVLKSERDEAVSQRDEALNKLERLAKEGKPKKEWLKDELIAEMQKVVFNQEKNNAKANKEVEEWKNKYFALLASTKNH